jgi:hypothetical protein
VNNNKKHQLGMNPSTASHRLVKDILWVLLTETGRTLCYRCGEEMTRDTFSIDHVVPWLGSDTPVSLYFDIGNISFSHLRCNIVDGANKRQKYGSAEEAREAHLEAAREWKRLNRSYSPTERRERYLRLGT